jgi:hypothetical protein
MGKKGLEGRAEALAGTFTAQDVANTLWAYATMAWERAEGGHLFVLLCICSKRKTNLDGQ